MNTRLPIGLLSLCLTASLSWANAARAEPNGDGAAAATLSEAGRQGKPTAGKEAKQLVGTIPDAKSRPIRTNHSVTIAGQRIDYVAETGMLPLLKSDGTLRASIFYVAYLRQGKNCLERRPVTFCFNGGPGSSSVWLHLGAFGPRRVRLGEPDAAGPTPFGLVDNEWSILDVTDLVFIDPVATGFSRPAEEIKAEQFFGKSPDIESVGGFIRLWTTRHDRWLSPKYVCGESYGVFRAAGLAYHLHDEYGMNLSGLILVSGLLSFAPLGDDLACQTFLPAFTAAAHFHKKLPPDLQADLPKALAEARRFVRAEYAAALFQGASLPPPERARIVSQLSRLTGLPPRVVEDNNLRIKASTFRKELLRDRGLILGRFDARITGRDAEPASNAPGFDPSLSDVVGAFAAAMNAYVRSELKFEDDLPYGLLSRVSPWKFEGREGYPSVTGDFASAMKEIPHLRTLVLHGQCDLACPIDSIRYDIEHLSLDPVHRRDIAYAEYASGHMMYVNLSDLRKMQKDLQQFLRPN
jgi:carboxypeptidase C (cathepsin A)